MKMFVLQRTKIVTEDRKFVTCYLRSEGVLYMLNMNQDWHPFWMQIQNFDFTDVCC